MCPKSLEREFYQTPAQSLKSRLGVDFVFTLSQEQEQEHEQQQQQQQQEQPSPKYSRRTHPRSLKFDT